MTNSTIEGLREERQILDSELKDMLALIGSELTDRRMAGEGLSFSPNLIDATLRYAMGQGDDDIMLAGIGMHLRYNDRWFEDRDIAAISVVVHVAEMSSLVNAERLKALKAIVLIGKPIHDRLLSYATRTYSGDEYDRRRLFETVIYLTVEDAHFDQLTRGLIHLEKGHRAFDNWYDAENLASYLQMATDDHADSIIEGKANNLRLMVESHHRFVSSS